MSRFSNDQAFNAVNLGQLFVLAVIVSSIWWQSDSIADKAGTLFFVSFQQSLHGLNVSFVKLSYFVFAQNLCFTWCEARL